MKNFRRAMLPKEVLADQPHPDDALVTHQLLNDLGDTHRWTGYIATMGERSSVNYTTDPDYIIDGKRRRDAEAITLAMGYRALGEGNFGHLPDGDLASHHDQHVRGLVDLAVSLYINEHIWGDLSKDPCQLMTMRDFITGRYLIQESSYQIISGTR